MKTLNTSDLKGRGVDMGEGTARNGRMGWSSSAPPLRLLYHPPLLNFSLQKPDCISLTGLWTQRGSFAWSGRLLIYVQPLRYFKVGCFGGVLIRTPARLFTVKCEGKRGEEEILSRLCCESLAAAQTSGLKPSVPSRVSTQSTANQIRYHDPTTPNLYMLLANNRRAKAAFFQTSGRFTVSWPCQIPDSAHGGCMAFVSSGASVMQFSCNFCNFFLLY